MELTELEKFNTWWTTGTIRPELVKDYKRDAFSSILKYMDKKLIIMLYGLRRMGKTTIMYQIISELLKVHKSMYVLYFSFDDYTYSIKDILNGYQEMVLNDTFDNIKENLYIFFDEIQKVPDWENQIKIYYDLYPTIKFILSGSASVSLRRKSNESLAGRIISLYIEPLSFNEFLEMNNYEREKIRRNPDMYKRELIPMLQKYMKYGTFPELAQNDDEDYAKMYIKESVIDRIIYRDIENEFKINDTNLVRALMKLIVNKPGLTLNFKAISENLGKDQRTISNYFEYLELGFLIKMIYNYRVNDYISLRKLKKCYPVTPNIIFALSDKFHELLPYVMENLVLMKIKTDYFYKNSYEIDFILVNNDKISPIEVKKTNRTEKQIKMFMGKYGERVENSLLITYDEEEYGNIRVIPLWKFLILQ
ncbi:ATP-binding protein [Ferroplasma sp.]|uniref:ATP-binding protein n=1 Tax=Ferroplasma sp. TaxID=2591003 RepID=UPI002603BDC0|nr:ATP-binding protein [Ferroplasma sp.]MCL4453896.1 ATP-binding protein [Candidatus Thermoplasmatota archaeon]